MPPEVVPPPEGSKIITNEYGYFTNPDLSLVPNLNSFNEAKTNLLGFDYPNFIPEASQPTKATKLTYVMMSWMIHHSWDGLQGADGKVKFEGFRNFFEDYHT